MTANMVLPQVVNLTESNPQLSPLQGRSYDKAFKVVPNRVLPGELISQLQVCYSVLTGRELDPEAGTLAVKSTNGVFTRLYAPSVYRHPEISDRLAIRWGDDIIELQGISELGAKFLMPKNMAMVIWHPGQTSEDDLDASLIFSSFKGGRGLDTTLKLAVFTPDFPNGLEMHFSCWLKDSEEFENITPDGLNGLIRRGAFASLVEFFKPMPQGANLQGETVSLADLKPAIYKVNAYKVVNTTYGPKAILQVIPTTDEGFSSSEVTGLVDPVQVWANQNISMLLIANSPTLSDEKPAKLYLHDVVQLANGKKRANAGMTLPEGAIDATGGLCLDF